MLLLRSVEFCSDMPIPLKPSRFALFALLSLLVARAEESVSVFLELAGPSLAEQKLAVNTGVKPTAAAAGAAQLRVNLLLRQTALEPGIIALGGKITGRFVTLVNAVRVLIPESRLAELGGLPGVVRVQRVHLYERRLVKSVPWVGAPSVWSAAGGGLTGRGVRIGIIDSGIDYLHADFGGSGNAGDYASNDPTVIEPGTFPTAKVVGGTDFVGDDYDGINFLIPDPDPLDPAGGVGHGTHVAGIAAGQGVAPDGSSYHGPYGNQVDFSGFKIGPGVAPEARLYALKIFGREGSSGAVVDGLDWAADPNQNGNLDDHLEVVNLSLGREFGRDEPGDIELQAVNRLAQLGCVVVISAGNNGDTSYILDSPGVAARAVTVASSIDDGTTTRALRVDAPAALAGNYSAVEGAAELTAQLVDTGPVTAPVVATLPADVCGTLQNPGGLAGKIALIDRGTCHFDLKLQRAEAAGAVGVIMINNVDGLPVPMGGSFTVGIPGVMISKADGARFRTQLAPGLTATLSAEAVLPHPELADRLDDFSSRGPVFRVNRLKPDLAAPGHGIFSAHVGTGGEGIAYDGTSMAAPHVAGAAALLRQAHPEWPAEDLKAALMNTAVATHDGDGYPYPESRTGAGRLRVGPAAATAVIAKASGAAGEVSLSFGAFELLTPLRTLRSLELVNHGETELTFTVSSTNTVVDTGVTITPVNDTVKVPAHGSAVVSVRLDADPARFTRVPDRASPVMLTGVPRLQLPESSGEVWFQSGATTLHVPWHAILRAASQFSTPAAAATVGLPAPAAGSLFLPTRGATAHNAPLASVFQLGVTDSSQGFTDDRAGTDVLAVGAASDRATAGSMAKTTVFFGLVVAGHWLTPQRAENNYDLEIDLNGDGFADYTLINGDTGTFAAGDVDAYNAATGALETIVRNEATHALVEGRPLNLLGPTFRDTAPFQNGVLIHAARAADIGLTSTKTSFRYRVVTASDYNDTTSWVTFDAAKPVLDPTLHGLKGTPLFDEGNGIQVGFNRANAGTATTVKALVLHQHNLAGRQHEVITLSLLTADADGDGLPDAWELEHFGDLAFNGTDDPDGDGVDNATEFARGTDPFKLRFLPPLTPADPLRWSSAAGRFYTLERTADLAAGFIPLSRHISAVAGTNSFNDPDLVNGKGPFFYRLRSE